MMQIQESVQSGVTVLRLFGEFDAASAPAIQERLQTLTSKDKQCVILDFSGVPFMSSAGLRVLQLGLKTARANGGELRLASVGAPTRSVLDQTGLSPLFRIYPTAEAALQEFQAVADDVAVIPLQGDLDAATGPGVEHQLRGVVMGGTHRLVLDLAQVPYVASAGLRVLQTILLAARSQQGDIRLACLQPEVRKVFDMLGFGSMFKTYDTVEAALLSF
jgi:anti-sigma B factor antagonist